MVEDYSSDQEQEEALRHWWRDNWRWVISGVALGLVVLGGWQYWQETVRANAEAAAQSYADLSAALAANNTEKVVQLTKDLDQKHSDSPYVSQAHLLLAQSKANAGQFEQAASELKLVVDKSKDVVLAQVARTRLARVQLQLGHADEALALLDVNKAGAFSGEVNEIRGDALLAKGDRSGARLAYQAAMNTEGAQESAADSELLRLKMQELQDTVSATTAISTATGDTSPPAK